MTTSPVGAEETAQTGGPAGTEPPPDPSVTSAPSRARRTRPPATTSPAPAAGAPRTQTPRVESPRTGARAQASSHPAASAVTTSTVLTENAAFFVILAALALMLPLIEDGTRTSVLFLAGLIVLGITLSAAVVLPWRRLPHSAGMAIPLLALLALGFICASGPRVALVGVLPVITLARGYGRVGAVTGILGGTAVAWADQISRPTGIVADTFPRLILLPVVLAVVATTLASVEQRSRARASLLVRQGAELQQAVDELVSERILVNAMMESLTVGVIVIDGDGRIAMVNPVVGRLTGLTVRVGDDAQELGARGGAEQQRLFALACPHRLATEPDPTSTDWWTMPDGSQRALRTMSATFTSRLSEEPHRLILIEDLTAEEQANVEREDLIGSVSHELRTPLTSIIGHLDLVLDDDTTTDLTQRHLEVAERNAVRLLNLVNDLLVAAAMRPGRGPGVPVSEPVPVDLAEVAADSVFAQQPRAAAAGVAVVLGDREGLAQVLDNVLSNAVKYSDPGDTVLVAVGRRGERAVVTVQDEGIGISAEDQARLFHRFFRSPAVRNTARHGTGLGLAITKQIVEALAGTIELRSRLGEGTTVQILLPAADAPPAAANTGGTSR